MKVLKQNYPQNIDYKIKYEKPSFVFLFLYYYKLISYLLINIILIPWMLFYFIKKRINPIVLTYTNSYLSKIGPDLPKNILLEKLKQNKELEKLIPETLYVPFLLKKEEKEKLIKEFLSEKSISFPVVAKPNEGTRSVGVFLIYDENSLLEFIKEINVNYLIQKHQTEEIELGLYFIRSFDFEHPDQYGIAVKYNVYGEKNNKKLNSLKTKFFAKDLTNEMTTDLKNLILNTFDSCNSDIGRMDVLIDSIENLFKNPKEKLKILEVNIGFDTIELHATDFRYNFIKKLKIIKNKWLYSIELGRKNYLINNKKLKFKQLFNLYLNYIKFFFYVEKKSKKFKSKTI